jgi:hypothetical protein
MSWQYHVIELPMPEKIREELTMLKSQRAFLLAKTAGHLAFHTESAQAVDFTLAER